jgi:hypothetical protein
MKSVVLHRLTRNRYAKSIKKNFMTEKTVKDAAYYQRIADAKKAEQAETQQARQRLADEVKLQMESHTKKFNRRINNGTAI